jgi:hypothetical protein
MRENCSNVLDKNILDEELSRLKMKKHTSFKGR